MDFIEAIKNCFIKYTQFSGRSSRSEFWYFFLFTTIISICADVIDASLVGQSFWTYDSIYGPVQSVFSIIIFLPSLAVAFRRLHDINKSGKWIFMVFTIIGIIPLIYWFARESDMKTNNYGEVPLEIKKNEKIYKLSKWIKFLLIPVLSVLYFLFFLSLAGVIPDTKVIDGDDLSYKNKNKLINQKIINKNDQILFFYSEGLFSILEGGQLITQDKLIAYGKNEDDIFEIWEMKLENIEDIEIIEKGSLFDSEYKVIGNNQSKYEYINIYLSTEGGGDKKFINYIEESINR